MDCGRDAGGVAMIHTSSVNKNKYGWDHSKTQLQNSDACETIINFVTFCANLAFERIS